MTAASEFPHLVPLDSLAETGRRITLAADEAERAALARRFGLIAIDALAADGEARRAGPLVHFAGRLVADVVQSCVATGDPVAAHVDSDFVLRFVPREMEPVHDEVELSEEDCDTIVYDGGAIDLGEAVAETLSLELDPFPRSPDADAVLRAAGVKSEEEIAPSGPFAALKGLLGK